MSVMNMGRRAAAALAVSCLLTGAAGAVAVPAQAAPSDLHVHATIDLGRLGSSFTYQFTEDPSGNVYYFRGSSVDVVRGDSRPVTILRAHGNVLAVTASTSDLFVDVGRTVTEYRLSNRRTVRSWTLAKSLGAPTSAGIYVVGSTVWAWTDWATDESGFEYASLSRFTTSSPAVHKVSSNNVYPPNVAADATGVYFETVNAKGANGYLVHVTPSGVTTKRTDVYLPAPLTLSNGNVFLLSTIQGAAGGKTYLDSYAEAGLTVNYSVPVPSKYTDIAGTEDGLLIAGGGEVGLVLTFAPGQVGANLGIRHIVNLVPGIEPTVVTYTGGKTYLVRIVLTG
jgi:hypothetical protein